MTRLALASLVAAVAVLALACSSNDKASTPTATPTAVATTTATTATAGTTAAASPPATRIPSEFTGLPAADTVIAAVLTGDLDRLVALAQLRQIACGPQTGVGSPPPCPAGQTAGTPVPVFPVGTCEGEWRSETSLRASLQPLLNGPELYAVYGMPSQWQPLMGDAQYVAVFSRNAPGQSRLGAGVVIAGGRIAGVWYGCGSFVDQIVPAGTSTLLGPRR
ncbi:MAG: hypothetical protein K1X87_11720 [Dehalococcoidia bacterium]|nr:hypothetical protein [Dehalococcoidia bacterium]HRC61862.1 hypothetical protein [Dehalococcoidia bacterium]